MPTDPAPDGGARLAPVLAQGVAAHRAGRLDDAQVLYRRYLDENPRDPDALQLLAVLHSQRGEHQAAAHALQELRRLLPLRAEIANDLGNALSRCGRPEEAVASYADAIRLQPQYADALRNLGLCYVDMERLDEARKCLEHCLQIRPEDSVGWLSLGNVHKRSRAFEEAIRCYERAIALRPDYAAAHHNLGLILRMQARSEEAIGHYETARRLGLDRAELYHNLGNALADTLDVRAAIDAYRAAVQRNARDLTSHRNLNSLLWQQELLDDYLRSYTEALAACPEAVDLRLAYAMALNQQESFEDAERVLVQGLRRAPESSALQSMLAYTLEGQRRWDEALRAHAAAVDLPGSTPHHRTSYARALLACGRPDEALQLARSAARQMPFNQHALAYLGLCWRLLGDERDAMLNDYRELVRSYEVPAPEPFRDAGQFNERLATVLEGLHVAKRYPPEQTLRGGTQTGGDLFTRRDPEIAALAAKLTECVRDYIERFPRNSEHPLFARRRERFRFAASWSVRLGCGGYHTMHVHPLGWISSAYYVQVPPEIADTPDAGGAIKFGEPDIDLGAYGTARRQIQPAVGRLVLFPSYMWHGTTPFESGRPRMTVAFDVVPYP